MFKLTFYSIVLTSLMCTTTDKLQGLKKSLAKTLKEFQQIVLRLEEALKTADKSLQPGLRNKLGEYYYRIAKAFSDAPHEQCSDVVTDKVVLVMFRDSKRPPLDICIENALFAVQASLGFRRDFYDADQLQSELETKKASRAAENHDNAEQWGIERLHSRLKHKAREEASQIDALENAILELKAAKPKISGTSSFDASSTSSTQPFSAPFSKQHERSRNAYDLFSVPAATQAESQIELQILGHQRTIVKMERLLATPEAEIMEDDLRSTLADLYYRVGTMLSEATDEECIQLVKERTVLLLADENLPAKDIVLQNAMNALRTSLFYRPTFPEVENALSKVQKSRAVSRASPAFLRSLFDESAETFDVKLAALKYVAPQEVAFEVARAAKERGRLFGSVLDAGCGTGLVGPLIRQYVNGLLVGADLSEKTLDRARNLRDKRGFPVYDELIAGDLLSLDFVAKPYELIVSADVLVYFGDFAPIMSIFKDILAPGGVLIFTCERLESSDTQWKLTESGRFSHERRYVTKAASSAGLLLADYREIVPRFQGGREVPGHLFVFVKTEGTRIAEELRKLEDRRHGRTRPDDLRSRKS